MKMKNIFHLLLLLQMTANHTDPLTPKWLGQFFEYVILFRNVVHH